MFPNNPYAHEKMVRMRHEELMREAAQNRRIRECERHVQDGKAVRLKYRLYVVLGIIGALAWFLH